MGQEIIVISKSEDVKAELENRHHKHHQLCHKRYNICKKNILQLLDLIFVFIVLIMPQIITFLAFGLI